MPPLDLDFLHRFVDREEELAAIESAWAAACQGKPQFVLLLGDSGLGKTRLVHKFYRTLHRQTAQTSGAHYWPAELDTSPRTLRINPDPPSGGHPLNEIPWFWLGLRWRQPDGINAGPHRPCALLDGEVQSVLAAHMDVLLRQRQRQADAQEAVKVTGDKAASDWLPYVLGPYALLYQIPKTLFDLWRSTRPCIRSAGRC